MATRKSPSKSVAKSGDNAIALFGDPTGQVPDHIRDASTGAGNENVSADDLALPQLKVLQAQSPELDGRDDLRPGMLFNTVTEDAAEEIYVINLRYDREFAVFKQRDLGGGLHGKFDTRDEAVAAIDDLPSPNDDYEVVETGRHTCMQVDPDTGVLSPLVILFSSTKLAVSREWNTQIRLRGPDVDRFAGVWRLSTGKQSNSKGSWFNFRVEFAGWAPENLYTEARKTFETLTGREAQTAETAAAG